jgi:hypothetical protein
MPSSTDLHTTLDTLQDLLDNDTFFAENADGVAGLLHKLCTAIADKPQPSSGANREEATTAAPIIDDEGVWEVEDTSAPPSFVNATDSEAEKLSDDDFAKLQDTVTSSKSAAAEAGSPEEKVELLTKAMEAEAKLGQLSAMTIAKRAEQVRGECKVSRNWNFIGNEEDVKCVDVVIVEHTVI